MGHFPGKGILAVLLALGALCGACSSPSATFLVAGDPVFEQGAFRDVSVVSCTLDLDDEGPECKPVLENGTYRFKVPAGTPFDVLVRVEGRLRAGSTLLSPAGGEWIAAGDSDTHFEGYLRVSPRDGESPYLATKGERRTLDLGSLLVGAENGKLSSTRAGAPSLHLEAK